MSLILPKYGANGNALSLLTAQRKDGDLPPRKTPRLSLDTASGSMRASASGSASQSGGLVKLSLINGPG